MAHQIGFVDNTGSEGLAHWQMLETIRRFALGYGTVAAPTYTGTGNGTLTGLDTYPATVSETWTITCTAAAANGGTFSVTGSVSGAQASATVGTPYDNGLVKFTLNDGSVDFAVNDAFTLVTTVGALPAAQRWTQLRYLTPTDGSNRELILQGVGLSGTEQIFIGFRAYHSVSADYYNLTCAGFTGYVAGNAFTAQPGYVEFGICAHNQRIDYWLAVNGQRIFMGLKSGTPVYEVGYTGKFFPYATPGQYPYPMACIGTLGAGTPAVRYSDTSAGHSSGVKGLLAQSVLRGISGNWSQFRTLPWTADYNNSPTIRRDTGGYYSALKTVLMTGSPNNPGGSGNVWGELDGIRYISGFNNVTENYIQIGGTPVTPVAGWTAAQADAAIAAAGGVAHFILQDVFRTGIGDYFLLEMN